MGLPERAIAYVDGGQVDFDPVTGQETYRVVLPTSDGQSEFACAEYTAAEFEARTGLSFDSLWKEPVKNRRFLPTMHTNTDDFIALAAVHVQASSSHSEAQIILVGDGGGFVHKGEIDV